MTADQLKQQLELPEVGQIGVVVEDLDRVASFLESSFGLGPFRVEEVEAPNVWDRGQEKHIKARLGFAMMGQVELELIHIVEGDSVKQVSEFVSGKLSTLECVQGTVTHFMLKKYKEDGFTMNDQEGPERMAVS